jgi:ADP-ribose pyrophosphatase YjhB (NUDIX family)
MTKPFHPSVKALIRDDASRYLLLRRSPSLKNNAGKWDMPGDKVDPEEAFDTGSRRQLRQRCQAGGRHSCAWDGVGMGRWKSASVR